MRSSTLRTHVGAFALLVGCTAGTPVAPAATTPAAPAAVDESKPHTHNAPHGGIVNAIQRDGTEMHAEALFMPAGVMFYLSDANQVALPLDGWTGNAVVKGPSGVVTVDLMNMGDHLHAPSTLVQAQPASTVVTLTKDGKAVSTSFSTETVGMQSHNHTPLHGGIVSMWGDHHVEYAPKDGEYRFWITDEKRNPVTGALSGSVKDGDKVVPLVAGADAMLTAKGDGAGTRPVMLSVTTEGTSFDLSFNPAAP